MFLVNSRLSLLPATSPSSPRVVVHPRGYPFFRRYGVNLPSSLTEDRSSTWRYLPLPTSDGVRYGRSGGVAERLFSAVWALDDYQSFCNPSGGVSVCMGPGFAWSPTYASPPTLSTRELAYPAASPPRPSSPVREYRTRCPSPTLQPASA